MNARMNRRALRALAIGWLILLATTIATSAIAQDGRQRINIDQGWRFAHGHAHDAQKDFGHGLRPFFLAKAGYGDGPASADFSDLPWRKVDLPHDWAVELPFDRRGDTNHGSRAIGRNFPMNSVGWYRKTLHVPAADQGRRLSLEFDGVYRNSAVWVNGHYIGTEPSGYSGFRYDITDYVNHGADNVIAVRVDASGEEGWYYEGAGIYRHVWLTKTDPLHVAQWGVFVKPTVRGKQARLDIDVTVANDAKVARQFIVRQQVFDPDGKLVVSSDRPARADAVQERKFTDSVRVPRPRLWALDSPQLYTLRTTLLQGGRAIDRHDTRFGIRTVEFDPDKGFILNGKSIKLQGTNNHQDHAGVGVALPDGLQAWRLNQLKSFGVNAYRASHHPPTPELLDEADRLGMLVINEHRMMGTTPEVRGQLERLIRRDRNHPSVVIWSLGNEEWALEWTELGTRLALEMHDLVKRLDPTRRTMVAASGSGKGVSVGADVIGFNYGAQHDVDHFHRDHPRKPAMMSEEGSTFTTRGVYVDDPARQHLNAYDRQARPGSSLSIEEGWQRVLQRDWMAGMFVWTGFDYRGETTPFAWPAVSSQFGMLDTTGVLKDTAYYLKSVWTAEPMVHILPHWNWPGKEGQAIKVHVYSNGDEVELLQDGVSLGRKAMPAGSHLAWMVPYRAGTLNAHAWRNGQLVAQAQVATTGPAHQVLLRADKTALKPDGKDVAVIWVNVADAAGRVVPTASDRIDFTTSGPIRIIGVGNGDPSSHEADRVAERHAFQRVTGWRSLPLDSRDTPGVHEASVDTATWRDPLAWIPGPARAAVKPYLALRGQFARPSLAAGERLVLFLDTLSPDQRVYVNGREVVVRQVDGASVVDLHPAELGESNNVTYVLSSPQGDIEHLVKTSAQTHRWGVLRIETPAPPWRRSVFNGWAQVIVQSTGEAGSASVVATSSSLGKASFPFQIH